LVDNAFRWKSLFTELAGSGGSALSFFGTHISTNPQLQRQLEDVLEANLTSLDEKTQHELEKRAHEAITAVNKGVLNALRTDLEVRDRSLMGENQQAWWTKRAVRLPILRELARELEIESALSVEDLRCEIYSKHPWLQRSIFGVTGPTGPQGNTGATGHTGGYYVPTLVLRLPV
jgi:hypothetical protein